ncbi:sensor domain-containing diguanylate cyclase [Pseudidiomarina woesei]|uniref:Diguanylate cyclase with PAS/PAC sensor n=1 Tax=Pseudidiomarina woesei TaxID=1381080 RepID=A0A0K6H1R0_9GAMM|nr:sensor domain-containing diguanylate cyclase [Pseudidiomarina woesei]CUA84917.1 diguanylate cyclase with PAS/PAC sensor [Pseudidiomarina woesei]
MTHPKLKTFEALGEYIDLLLDAICVVNPKGEFIYVSAGGERVFGYAPQEMIGHSMYEFMHPDDHERTHQATTEIMQGVVKFDFENRYIRKSGEVATILWSARYSEKDDLRVAVARDVTAQRKVEKERQQLLEKLEKLAMFDPLTELPNRSYFYQRATQALEHHSDIAIVYIDLNHFKEINDKYGHAIGDQILHAAAQRLSTAVRSHDTVARIGGDEFVVLLERIQQQSDAEAIVKKIQHALGKAIQIASIPNIQFDLAASFGIALSKQHGNDLEKLLLHADNAMYKAKRNA